MPIQEYKCLKCGTGFELRRSMDDWERKVKCPKCGGENTQPEFSRFSTASAEKICVSRNPF